MDSMGFNKNSGYLPFRTQEGERIISSFEVLSDSDHGYRRHLLHFTSLRLVLSGTRRPIVWETPLSDLVAYDYASHGVGRVAISHMLQQIIFALGWLAIVIFSLYWWVRTTNWVWGRSSSSFQVLYLLLTVPICAAPIFLGGVPMMKLVFALERLVASRDTDAFTLDLGFTSKLQADVRLASPARWGPRGLATLQRYQQVPSSRRAMRVLATSTRGLAAAHEIGAILTMLRYGDGVSIPMPIPSESSGRENRIDTALHFSLAPGESIVTSYPASGSY
jgi:hypothetical protein